MKFVTMVLALSLTAPAFANDPVDLGKKYEVQSQGCLMTSERATCVITNKLNTEVICDLRITAKTEKGLTIGNTRKRAMRARSFIELNAFAAEGDAIKSVEASAECAAIVD